MKELNALENLLEKYKLISPIPKVEKRNILKSKRRTLSYIIKTRKYNSVYVSAAVYFNDLLAGLGFKTTLAGSARAFTAALSMAAVLFLAVPAGILYNSGVFKPGIVAVEDLKDFEKGSILFAKGDVKIVRGRRDIAVTPGALIATGDKVTTGKESSVIFQMQKGFVRLLADSECAAGLKLNKKLIELSTGKLLCSVEFDEGGELKVVTPNAEVLVVGTVFSVEYKNETTTVSVERGVVQVKNLKSGETVLVEAGGTATVGEKTEVKESDQADRHFLHQFGNLGFPETGADEAALNSFSGKIESMDREAGMLGSINSLEDIKERYGKLEEIELYNGRRYKGAIISRGAEFTFVTITGVRKFQSRSIKNVRIIE